MMNVMCSGEGCQDRCLLMYVSCFVLGEVRRHLLSPGYWVAIPFDMEMSYSSASTFEETEDISDEGVDFSSDTLKVLTLMETVR